LLLVIVDLINKFLLRLRNLLLLQTDGADLKLTLELLIFRPEVWNILGIEYRWLVNVVTELILLIQITELRWLFGTWLNIWRLRYVQFFVFHYNFFSCQIIFNRIDFINGKRCILIKPRLL
jgi:hypothetical protein